MRECDETRLLVDGDVILEGEISDGNVFKAPFVEEFDGGGSHNESARRDVDLKRNGSCLPCCKFALFNHMNTACGVSHAGMPPTPLAALLRRGLLLPPPPPLPLPPPLPPLPACDDARGPPPPAYQPISSIFLQLFCRHGADGQVVGDRLVTRMGVASWLKRRG